jgi:hypothetical protein
VPQGRKRLLTRVDATSHRIGIQAFEVAEVPLTAEGNGGIGFSKVLKCHNRDAEAGESISF